MTVEELTALMTTKFYAYKNMDRMEGQEDRTMIAAVAAWLHLEDEGDRYLKWDLEKMVRDSGALSSVIHSVGLALRDLADKAPEPEC